MASIKTRNDWVGLNGEDGCERMIVRCWSLLNIFRSSKHTRSIDENSAPADGRKDIAMCANSNGANVNPSQRFAAWDMR